MPAFPCQNIDLFYKTIYGGFGWGREGCGAYLGLASGLPQTGNPPYYINSLLAIYSKWFGPATLVSAETVQGDPTISVDSTATGLAPGQFVSGQFIDNGTVINGLLFSTESYIVVNNPPIGSGPVTLSVYEAPPVPLALIQLYINIAFASLMQSRWREQWPLAMALYVAHYLTLWEQTEGNPQTTASQIVANSLQAGITISQGADGVNQGLAILETLASWGTWTLTQYGVQLATLAKLVGSGPIYVRAGGCVIPWGY